MFDQLEKHAETLRNTNAGWVSRRDAADDLGRIAAYALVALREHQDEMDTDVRRSIDKALAQASAALAGIKPEISKSPRLYTLEELVRACQKEGSREISPYGDGYVVEVTLHSGRKQRVYVEPFTRKDGLKLVRVYTYCGAYTPETAGWALRANMKMAQGALAVTTHEEQECFVLTNCYLSGEVTPAELKTSVKEIAFYGDWMEEKLEGGDTL